MKVEKENSHAMIKLLRELNILQFLNNSMVQADGMKNFYAGLLDAFCPKEELDGKDVTNLFVVMRYSEYNLAQAMQKIGAMSLNHIKVILYNLLCSLNYMHSCQIVHRDIKP